MTEQLTRSTLVAHRSDRSRALSRSIVGTLLLALGVAAACGDKTSDYLCQRQTVNANRTKITPLSDKSYSAKNQSDAENDCIADSQSSAAAGESAECSCSPTSSKNRIAPTAPTAP